MANKFRITMEFHGEDVTAREGLSKVCDIIRAELSERFINFPLIEEVEGDTEHE